MEENKFNESQDDPIKSTDFFRKNTRFPTSLPTQPGLSSGYFTQLTDEFDGKLVLISSAQYIIQSNIVKSLILGKILATLLFVIAIGKSEQLFFVLMLVFEYFGYYGSTNFKYKCKLAFLSYLVVNILVRIATSWYYFSLISDFSDCIGGKIYSGSICKESINYIFGSLMFIALEVLQFIISLRLAKNMTLLSNSKKAELEFIIRSQSSVFFCIKKNKSWTP